MLRKGNREFQLQVTITSQMGPYNQVCLLLNQSYLRWLLNTFGILLFDINGKMDVSFITKHRSQECFASVLLLITHRDFLCYIAMCS